MVSNSCLSDHVFNTHTLTPYSFWPFNTFIASIASGIGLPPRMRTPSISNAYAKLSVVVVSGGVLGLAVPSLESRSFRRCLASSKAAAVS